MVGVLPTSLSTKKASVTELEAVKDEIVRKIYNIFGALLMTEALP